MPSFRVLPVSHNLVIVSLILAISPSPGCGRVGFDLLPRPDEGTCNPSASRDVTCDGVDDDCDGEIDEDFQGRSTMCGVGACDGNPS